MKKPPLPGSRFDTPNKMNETAKSNLGGNGNNFCTGCGARSDKHHNFCGMCG